MAPKKTTKKKSSKKKKAPMTEEEKEEAERKRLEAEEAKAKLPVYGWIKLTVSQSDYIL